MDFVDAVKVMLRRWYLVLAGALVTVGAAAGVILYVPTQYQATAQYLLLLPATSNGEDTPINPFINLPSDLTVAVGLLAADMQTPDQLRDLTEHGFDSEFTVGVNPSQGPVIALNVRGSDPADVVATRDQVIRRLDQNLAEMQDLPGIPQNQVIFSRISGANTRAEAVPGAKIKALAVAGMLGVTLTLILTFSLDKALLARRAASAKPAPAKRRPEKARK